MQITQITQIQIESRSADPIARPAPARRGISASMPQHLAFGIWHTAFSGLHSELSFGPLERTSRVSALSA